MRSHLAWEVTIDQDQGDKLHFKIVNPFPGYKLGFFEMAFGFARVWFIQKKSEIAMSTKQMRLTLAFIIPFIMIFGMGYMLVGLLKYFGLNVSLMVVSPYHTSVLEFYWGIFVIGTLLVFTALYGIYGIFGNRIKSTRAFALVSFIYGQGAFAVSVSWLVMSEFERLSIIKQISDVAKSVNMKSRDPIFTHSEEKQNIKMSQVVADPFLYYTLQALCFQAVFLTCTGILTTVLLKKEYQTKGCEDLCDE